MSRVLVVCGSPSPISRTAIVLGAVALRLVDDGHDVDHLDLRTLSPQALLRPDPTDRLIREASDRLDRADAVVLGTPIYKASYSGLLKVWFDGLSQYPFHDKTILPLATGGSLANVLALDYALRPVLAAMGATHVVQSYFVLDRQVDRDAQGTPALDSDTQLMLDGVVDAFLDALKARQASERIGDLVEP